MADAQERPTTASEAQGGAAADPSAVGDTGVAVIGGVEIAGEGGGRDAENDPDLSPITEGDVSQTPAAQSGTRGAGTGADMGTGAEVGITRPGVNAVGD